jgi:putative sigma-54 modulation protein
MQVKVSSRHGHVSAQDEAILVEKGTKLQRFLDKVSEILITVDLQHLEEVMVEINVWSVHSTGLCRRWNNNCESRKKK